MGARYCGWNNDVPPTPTDTPVNIPTGLRRNIDNHLAWISGQSRGCPISVNGGCNIVSNR